MKAKKKRKYKQPVKPRLVGRDAISQLYRGVVRYVEKNGGSIIVIGGVQVVEWPEDRPGVYGLQVKIMGRKPKFALPTGLKPIPDPICGTNGCHNIVESSEAFCSDCLDAMPKKCSECGMGPAVPGDVLYHRHSCSAAK